MRKFAKLFEIDGNQLLVMRNKDDEDETPGITFTTELEHGQVEIYQHFKSEADRDTIFDSVNDELAVMYLEHMKKTGNQFF